MVTSAMIVIQPHPPAASLPVAARRSAYRRLLGIHRTTSCDGHQNR
jgi:hypothetical protein